MKATVFVDYKLWTKCVELVKPQNFDQWRAVEFIYLGANGRIEEVDIGSV